MKELGLSGRIIKWTADFLRNRSIRVKINNTVSDRHHLQNGTPQGSVISPILFLIMINDFPKTDSDTSTSLFADDSAIWRSGKNFNHIVQQLQIEVDKITTWCDLWGFKLNEKKCVAIVFTKNRQIAKSTVLITINQKLLQTVKHVKFLGVTFDQRLDWTEHIKNITNSCTKKINLLRSLTGHHWGASKRTLLQIYKTLIRPKLEYGCELFHTASKTNLNKIQVIQNTCLRIACGAMKGTAADAVQQECGELSMKLRRKQQLLRYTAKISTSVNNPVAEILTDTWHNYYGKYKPGTESVYVQIKSFQQQYQQHRPDLMKVVHKPPWKRIPVDTDTTLMLKISKNENPLIKKQLALELINKHDEFLAIYTDGSKHKN